MSEKSRTEIAHPPGDLLCVAEPIAAGPVVVDTYAGPVKAEWDPDANVTPLGHFVFFVEYLKSGGRFDAARSRLPSVLHQSQ